jgi:large subunit ribosomal protein L31
VPSAALEGTCPSLAHLEGSGSRPHHGGDPAAHDERGTVKADTHPTYVDTHGSCTCGNEFTTRSTVGSGEIRAEVCAACHPFYTGKQKILDTGGRVARFEQRFGKRSK